jgi:tRNA modification GTPase
LKQANNDTIAAVATAPGRGSVGIVRLSGPAVPDLCPLIIDQTLKPRLAHYGPFRDPVDQSILDEGIALFFPNPHSFTGEDVLELQGHGGPVVMDLLLRAVIRTGRVRLARPGEFSERAFLNDKLDLTQVEAIADLIDASSQQAARNAIRSLQGVFSEKIHHLVEQLTQLRVYVEAAIDFPEDEIDFLQDRQLTDGIDQLQRQVQDICRQAQQGVVLREGMTVVIAGKPNVGKSSLLNALAGRDSAIVTDIPGTTRDLLREHIHLDGMPLHIIDTAGLRAAEDDVERMGMARAWQEIEKADRILLLVDSSEVSETMNLQHLLPGFGRQSSFDQIDPVNISIVFTKRDLLDRDFQLPGLADIPQLNISVKNGAGLDQLVEHLQAVIGYQSVNESGFTARRRHLDALSRALECVTGARRQLAAGMGELVAEELRQAQKVLGEITGAVSVDDLLDKIFSSFCIGK